MDKVLVFVEAKEEKIRKVSLELLSESAKLAGTGGFTIEALFLGKLPEEVKEKILQYAEKLVHVIDPMLDNYTAEGYALVLARYAREVNAQMILAGATRIGRDFMPRVAAALQTGIVSDVTAVKWSEEHMIFVKPMYGGRVLADIVCSTYPVMATIRPNSFGLSEPPGTGGEYTVYQAGIPAGELKTSVVKIEKTVQARVDLTEADLIVAGGRGLKTAENFKLLEELADVMGATVGATRSVVDAKWRDQSDQVGKSGKTVSPKLYLGAGISGAIHHIMGMDTSKVVLAINTDPNAIFFNYADYGIVGDLFEVLPAMTEELKKRLGKLRIR